MQNDLIELLQFHALKHTPTTLEVRDDIGRRAQIGVDSGEIVHARTAGGISGAEALVEVLSWQHPAIVDVVTGAGADRNIDVPLDHLLMDVSWRGGEHQPVEKPSPIKVRPHVLPVTLPDDNRIRELLTLTLPTMEIAGFVAATFVDTKARSAIEAIGEPVEFAPWMQNALLAMGPDVQFTTVAGTKFHDALIPRTRFEGIGLLLRVSARETSLGLLTVAIKALLETDLED